MYSIPYVLLRFLDHYKFIPEQIGNAFAVGRISAFYRFYLLGYIISKHNNIEKLIRNEKSIFFLISIFIGIIYLQVEHKNIYNAIPPTFISIMLTLAVYVVMRSNSEKIQQRFPKLSYIGKRSLDIYLIHFFLFATVPNITYPVFISYWFVDIVVKILLAGVFVYASVIIGSFVRSNKYMALFFLGQKLR
jgi:peptidoglycan/LPS O-acetylase OafA/YrhL